MSEDQPNIEGQEPLKLDPRYVPATEDTYINLRFVGNTPIVGGFNFSPDMNPFYLWAAADWLNDQANFMAQQGRIKAMQEGIVAARPGMKMPVPPPGG